MPKIRVLIVDDHPLMLRGMRETLADEPELEICAEATDIADALARQRGLRIGWDASAAVLEGDSKGVELANSFWAV